MTETHIGYHKSRPNCPSPIRFSPFSLEEPGRRKGCGVFLASPSSSRLYPVPIQSGKKGSGDNGIPIKNKASSLK